MSEESTKKLLTLYNEKIFLSSKDPRMVEYGNFREENMDVFVKDYVKGRCKGVLNNE